MNRTFLVAILVTAGIVLVPGFAQAQLPEGISLGITPTIERVEWGDDVLLDDATLWGGRLSLNFGRFVALQGYVLKERDEVEFEGGPADLEGAGLDIDRRGADLVLTAASTRFAPFLRVGAGTIDFEGPGGLNSEHITATLGAGLSLDLSDRAQLQAFAQDLAFRATRAPFLDREPGEEGLLGDEETFHNLSYGAGLTFYLGGESVQPETDEAILRQLQGGLGGVAIPIEVFGGELQFDDELGLDNQNVAGLRAGINLGPYVGLRGYFMRGVNDDLDDFDEFEGYGGEANFNLNRGEGFTPYLVLGLGRLNFDDERIAGSGLTEDEKWTATAGAGLAFNLSPRFRVEAAARNLLLAQGDAEDVTAPDELKSNWLFSGGLRFAIGGTTADEEDIERIREEARREGRDRGREDDERAAEEGEQVVLLERELELDKARVETVVTAEGDTLRVVRERRRAPETFEMPILEEGEIYIRFGESGTFERAFGPVAIRAPADSLVLVDTLGFRRAGISEERLAEALDRGGRRLEELDRRLARIEERGAADIDVRVGGETPPVVVAPEVRERDEEEGLERIVPGERGVFNGAPMRVTRLALYSGASASDPQQLLLGLNADVGSAFGGRARFVPELTLGFIDDVSLNINGHLEWTLDREYANWQPYLGTGLGLFATRGEVEIFIPNFILGAIYTPHPYRPFIAYQGLDLFDDHRFLVGVRRF
ncbi:hypothetical protein BH18GEM1_BH18GEM1_21170 [soil metagenome]